MDMGQAAGVAAEAAETCQTAGAELAAATSALDEAIHALGAVKEKYKEALTGLAGLLEFAGNSGWASSVSSAIAMLEDASEGDNSATTAIGQSNGAKDDAMNSGILAQTVEDAMRKLAEYLASDPGIL